MTTAEQQIDAAAEAVRARAAARQARQHADAAEAALEAFVTEANVRPNALLAALFPSDPRRALDDRLRAIVRGMRDGEQVSASERDEVLALASTIRCAELLAEAVDALPASEFSALDRVDAQARIEAAHAHRVAAYNAARDAQRHAGDADAAVTQAHTARRQLAAVSDPRSRAMLGPHPPSVGALRGQIAAAERSAADAAREAQRAAEQAESELAVMRAILTGEES